MTHEPTSAAVARRSSRPFKQPATRCLPKLPVDKRHWTESEQTQLIQWWNIDGLSASQIARRLGRSRNSVIGRAHRSRLQQHESNGTLRRQNCRVWSASDDAKLAELFPIATLAELAKEFGAEKPTIRRRARHLGLLSVSGATARKAPVVRRNPSAPHGRPGHSFPQELRDLVRYEADPTLEECVSLIDLRIDGCRWPIGYPAKFCGRKSCRHGHRSYCESHYARSVT